jgi:hypothetical protein
MQKEKPKKKTAVAVHFFFVLFQTWNERPPFFVVLWKERKERSKLSKSRRGFFKNCLKKVRAQNFFFQKAVDRLDRRGERAKRADPLPSRAEKL